MNDYVCLKRRRFDYRKTFFTFKSCCYTEGFYS
jgi:hypothetical protein